MGLSFRTAFALVSVATMTAAAVACGGGSTGGNTGGGGSGSTSTTVGTTSSTTATTSATTTSTTSGTTSSTSTGGGDGGDCQTMCIDNNPQAAAKFEGYELKECGCAASQPCNSQCTAECADPSKLNQTSPCGMCLLAEAGKGTSSPCTVKAGLTDCSGDAECSPFLNCILGCM